MLIVSNQKEESITIQRVNVQLVSPVMDFRSFYMFFQIKKSGSVLVSQCLSSHYPSKLSLEPVVFNTAIKHFMRILRLVAILHRRNRNFLII